MNRISLDITGNTHTHMHTHTADYPATPMGHSKALDCCYGSYRDEEEGGGMMRWWAQTPTTKREKINK